jgi:hypothetical protein
VRSNPHRENAPDYKRETVYTLFTKKGELDQLKRFMTGDPGPSGSPYFQRCLDEFFGGGGLYAPDFLDAGVCILSRQNSDDLVRAKMLDDFSDLGRDKTLW